jgi:hypothetical protein
MPKRSGGREGTTTDRPAAPIDLASLGHFPAPQEKMRASHHPQLLGTQDSELKTPRSRLHGMVV